MKSLFHEATQAEELYRQIIDNALDAFIAIDCDSSILEWSRRAEETFGWSREETIGLPLTAFVIPERYRQAHLSGLRHHLETGGGRIVGRRMEMQARRKDGSEIPVELTVTPIDSPGRKIFFASLRDISARRALEDELHHQVSITQSILNSIAGAVVVADLAERLIMVNPAAQRLLNVAPVELRSQQLVRAYTLLQQDGQTPYPDEQRPTLRALRGEHVDGFVAMIRHDKLPDGAWVSVNARPLLDSHGKLVGGVAIFHDITELRRREEALGSQARQLQEQASLLDLAHDAILARTTDDIITYWNLSAEKLYGYSRAEAVGQHSHTLLKARFPQPLEEIRAIVRQQRYWEGELIHVTRDGRELTIFSQWALDFLDGLPYRYLETNADITQQVQTERALRQSQEDFRMLVEASTDHAIMMIDPDGVIMSWNSGAERIIGLSVHEAVGRPVATLFTVEDRGAGEPMRQLEEARDRGRSDDDRWHIRHDGTRFWATGVVTPLWNDDGSLRGYVKIMRDQTSQRLAEEQTRFLANHDGLTGLPNRVNFSNQLHQSIALSQRNNIPLALLLLDLDRFKYVNDTFGHHTGDLLLKEVALRIVSSIRETDFVARLGGDEFVIIQADVSQPEAADTLARKLVLELGRPYQLDSNEVMSGTSIGLSVYPKDAKNPVELLKRADLALYRAKNAGRHNYQFYTADLFSEQTWKRDREAALRAALKNHQFELYYQPQVDLSTWRITTVEALLRWNAAEMETVLPNEFLDIVEQTGLIVEVGEWALREAAHQVRRWQAQGLHDLRLSLNCSARQFSDPKFVTMIPSVLKDAGITPDSLELEVPEAMLARHPEIKEQLSDLRALGIRITIDNFGTGATALMDFKEFGIDVLKIDRAFVQHLPHRREDSAITSAIISLAHNLGVAVVAGGVETAEQLAYLKARDCTSAQGFIFSPPVPAQKFEELLHDGTWSHMNRIPAPGGLH
ncbi:MAG TPA: PAS domain S-box protein [Noviherbaspirillum sp.]|uniref:sensor domain-containing protein n=1 Tax=Noviherbaspirillum sp. TaxID=1926288 RepID=UPI002D23EBAF|nr:PAS domain S-box protein [Noviherbaspirillum sp.]HYD97582.1 PAS domain S-box protein [Noviherbaspirillum sp.]